MKLFCWKNVLPIGMMSWMLFRSSILQAPVHSYVFLLRRLDRLNAYTEYAYCDKIDSQMEACSWRYFRANGNVMTHPRKTQSFMDDFRRPDYCM